MTAILYSGGWESTFCLLKSLKRGEKPRAYFFDYGQPYFRQESSVVASTSSKLGVQLITIPLNEIPHEDGIFPDRNRTFVEEVLRRYGEKRIYLGIRGILPGKFFDRWGDTNWVFARRLAKELGIELCCPALLHPKHVIQRVVRKSGLRDSDVFSSEGWDYSKKEDF